MKKGFLFRIIVFFIAGASLLLYFFIDPVKSNFPSCIFHEFTGLFCPGCGVQRSFHALLNGNLLQAIDYNLLFIFCLPLLIYFFIIFFSGAKWKKDSFISNPYFSYTILVIFISFWILRNLPFAPFNYLAP